MDDDIKYKMYKKKFDKIMSKSACRQCPVFVSSTNCRRQSRPYYCGACPSCCGNPCMPCLDDEENFIESIMPFVRCLPVLKKMQLRTLYLNSLYEIMLQSQDEACTPVFPPYKPSKPVCMQDDDELFYWGLIPNLKSLPPEKRLKSRVVFFENLYNVYGDASTGYGDGTGYDKKMKYIDKLRELNEDAYLRSQNFDGPDGEYGGYRDYGGNDIDDGISQRRASSRAGSQFPGDGEYGEYSGYGGEQDIEEEIRSRRGSKWPGEFSDHGRVTLIEEEIIPGMPSRSRRGSKWPGEESETAKRTTSSLQSRRGSKLRGDGEYGGYSGYGEEHDIEEEITPRKTTSSLQSGGGPRRRGEFAEGGEFSRIRGRSTTSSASTGRPGTPYGVPNDSADTGGMGLSRGSLFAKSGASALSERSTARRSMLKSMTGKDDRIYSRPSQENIGGIPHMRSIVSIKSDPSVRKMSEVELEETMRRTNASMGSRGRSHSLKPSNPSARSLANPSARSLSISPSGKLIDSSKSVSAFRSVDLIKSRQSLYDKF